MVGSPAAIWSYIGFCSINGSSGIKPLNRFWFDWQWYHPCPSSAKHEIEIGV
jgi:hypothetical protein